MIKTYERVCPTCGKEFKTIRKTQKFCSKSCVNRARWSICCTCKNSTGLCSWSHNFIPVKGWEAEQTTIHNLNGDIVSYKVFKCPKYLSSKRKNIYD